MTGNDELPPRARAKIFALVDQEAAIQTAISSNLRAINELSKAYDIASAGTHQQAKLKAEADRRQEVLSSQRDKHRALVDLNSKIKRFLDLLPAHAVLDDAKRPKIKLKAGETHQQAVTDLRGRILQLLAEKSQVERAALPTDEIKAQLKKWIVQQSMKRPTILATHDAFDIKYENPQAFTPKLEAIALLAWFDPDHLETKLNEIIDERPKPQLALTPLEKAERLAAIKIELADCEGLECALISDALDAGTLIDYRPNTDLRAMLGIVVSSRSKAHAAA